MQSFRYRQKRKLVALVQPYLEKAKRVTIPGFDKIPIYDVGVVFFKGIRNGAITTRAASVAFSLIMAIFPAIIFLFTLIPILPIQNFQEELLLLIESLLPESTYDTVEQTIKDILMEPHSGLLSFGFVLAMFFSTNGIMSLIVAFNASINVDEKRSWLMQRAIAILLVLILTLLMTTGIILIIFTQTFLDFLVDKGWMFQNFTYYLVTAGKWFVILAIFYFAYSFLYFLAPARKSKYRFISAGSTVATVLSILVIIGFGFYIDHFGKYNALYGSIGTLPVIMMMSYLNCLAVIIGFELNIGIVAAKRRNEEKLIV